MRMATFLAVDQLHEQWPLDVKLRDLVESRGRKKNLGAVVEFRSLVSRRHNDGITSVIFVESLDDRSACLAGHVVEVIRVARIEICAKTRLKLGKFLVRKAAHTHIFLVRHTMVLDAAGAARAVGGGMRSWKPLQSSAASLQDVKKKAQAKKMTQNSLREMYGRFAR